MPKVSKSGRTKMLGSKIAATSRNQTTLIFSLLLLTFLITLLDIYNFHTFGPNFKISVQGLGLDFLNI